MAILMTSKELVQKMKDIAEKYKTIYMWGTFGSPVTEKIIAQKAAQYPERYSASRQADLRALIGKGYFAFDCVGLIKGVFWGWDGSNSTNGGAVYQSNGVPDTTASGIMNKCYDISTDMNADITVGSALYKYGHVGVYIGNGKVVEATISQKQDGVAISDLSGNGWTKHGKFPWVDYSEKDEEPEPPEEEFEYEIGNVVYFKGGPHYSNSNATEATGGDRTPGTAEITNVAKGAKHPYHLVAIEGGGSNVYGWVDAKQIGSEESTGKIKVGSHVKLKSDAKVYGKNYKFDSWVYNDVWVVSQINGDRAVIDKNVSGTHSINSPVNINDLVLA